MRSVKSRNWSNQEDQDLAVVMDDLQQNQKKLTWNQIADLIKQRNPDCTKNGKQCRERWTNQISPNVKRFEEWSKEENQKLFTLHHKLGNKWSEISSKLPGRTDNCIKNHFYSVMRKGFRKVNSYIENVRRKRVLVKTFKNEILNKILTICQGKNNDKFQLSPKAKDLSLSIKQSIVKIALLEQDDDYENLQMKQSTYLQICQFTRNCRKKKTKKINQDDEQSKNSRKADHNQISYTQQKSKKKGKKEDFICYQNHLQSDQKQEQKIASRKSIVELSSIFDKVQIGNKKTEMQFQQDHASSLKQVEEFQLGKLQRSELFNSSMLNSKLISSFSYNFPHRSNSSLFNFGSAAEGNQQWVKNSEIQQNKNTNSFIYTVPDVTNKKRENQPQAKRGQMDFNNLGSRGIIPELSVIFQKSFNSTVVISEMAKSVDMQKSFSFSSAIKESPILFQLNPEMYSFGTSFSNSPFPALSNSSGFGMYNSNSWLGKQAQQAKLRSTKYEESEPNEGLKIQLKNNE